MPGGAGKDLHAVQFDAQALQLAERILKAKTDPTAYKSDLGSWKTVELLATALVKVVADAGILLQKRNQLAQREKELLLRLEGAEQALEAERGAVTVLESALKAFLHDCEYHKSPPMDKPCGQPAVYFHAGYEGEIWWACKRHGTDKRFRWVGDFELDSAQVAAREALTGEKWTS